MNDAGAVRPCPMCHAMPDARRSTIRNGVSKFEIVACISCRFVYVLNPQGETFHPVQAAPAEVPERARHRQIKRVCDHYLTRQPASDGTYSVVEVGAGWGGLAQVFARDDRYRYVGLEPSVDRVAFCRAHGPGGAAWPLRRSRFDRNRRCHHLRQCARARERSG